MHEHIKSIAKEAGVNFVEGLDDSNAEKQAREREAIRARVSKALSDTPEDERDKGYDMAMEALGVLDVAQEDYETMQEAPEESVEETQEPQMQRGLMARG